MKKLPFVACAALLASASPAAAQGVPVSLVRLDCGTVSVNDLNQFSDTRAYDGQTKRLTSSCYLIRHGDTYMLWDTGLPAAMKGAPIDPKAPMSATVTRTIVDQLAQIGIKPAQIATIGISHFHFDHIGQAAAFPQATMLIGKGDFDALSATPPTAGADPAPLKNWIGGPGKVTPVTGDKDVFGDGSVTMLDLPGHTPGHHGLLVKLAHRGYILLTGDAAHFHENYDTNGVPTFNFDRSQTLASLDRFKALARNLKVTVIIQHDERDIAKLPAFPNWAD